jgi:DNA polymerase-1
LESDGAALFALFQELEFTSLLKEFSSKSSPEKTPPVFQRLQDPTSLNRFLDRLRQRGCFVLSLETGGPALPMESDLLGLALLVPEGEGGYIPLNRNRKEREQFLETLHPILEEKTIEKKGHDLKGAVVLFNRLGINLQGLAFDTMIAAYLINPGRSDYTLETLSLELLGKELVGDTPMERPEGEGAYLRSVQTLQLVQHLKSQLSAHGLESLFIEMEMPLIPVLARMEMNGFKLDVSFLEGMSKEFERQLQGLMERIYQLAGEEFNINSPKQLQEILFRKLNLTPIKKTKTGYSTDEGVLIQLSLQHELPAEILNYRQLTKLKSTYVDALPRLVHPRTGRLHTSLNQTVAATGRLSSSDPNLQNIPIRTDVGRRIREAFIVEEGNLLLSADYNQIELRILAHMSGDERLVEAFRNGEDIHLRTAVEIFGLPSAVITSEMRRAAKTVNFGIIYGVSPYGLAAQLGVSQSEAKKYIDNYFVHYAGVKEFINRTIEEARKNGFVTTFFNRRRSVADLQSQEVATRGFGERIAINTPIQGSAADLIKLAMIRIDQKLRESALSTMMILQIHDELLFEVPEQEMEQVKALVCEAMEGIYPLKVPLKVDLGTGRNWAEAH